MFPEDAPDGGLGEGVDLVLVVGWRHQHLQVLLLLGRRRLELLEMTWVVTQRTPGVQSNCQATAAATEDKHSPLADI